MREVEKNVERLELKYLLTFEFPKGLFVDGVRVF